MVRTIYGDHNRFLKTYMTAYPGTYFTGDGCTRDADGHYWITGRVDDVINVSGHRLGSAEIESALVTHPQAAEAAVVGIPHAVKGQALFAYVIPKVLELLQKIVSVGHASHGELVVPPRLASFPAPGLLLSSVKPSRHRLVCVCPHSFPHFRRALTGPNPVSMFSSTGGIVRQARPRADHAWCAQGA